MSDLTFGTWSAASSPVSIEYSLVVVEEIRREVAEGYQKLSRGGIEVGGLLYGAHEGQTIRVMAIRPAACEHSSGPSFRLSEKDRAALQDQIRQDRDDPRLEGLVCVGWYVSHTRTEIALTEADQEIFSSYFPEPWQVALVVRPSRGGNMRAGFFVWEPGGTVDVTQSYLEFTFPDRLAAVFDPRASSGGRKVPEQRTAPRAVVPLAVAAQETPRAVQASPIMPTLLGELAQAPESTDSSHSDAAQKRPGKKKWIWLVAALIVIAALAAAGARYLSLGSANQTIALGVVERDGQLNIEWNRTAAPVSKAVRGTLEIADGPQTQTAPLTPAVLALGKFSYRRATGDVQVRMIVESADGKKTQEASRFVGPPPTQGSQDDLKTLQQRRDELEAEVARLKQSNDEQAQRIQQLERTLKILQTRPGVN